MGSASYDESDANSERIAMIVIGLVIAAGLGFLAFHFADMLQAFGGGRILYALTGLLASIIVLCFGIFSILQNMYMSSDIEILITLPFSSMEIAILRVLSYLQKALIFTVICLIPVQVGISIRYMQPLSVYIVVLLSCIMIPVFITGVIAAIVILIMSFITLLRNIQILRYIGAFFGFLAILAYYFFASNEEIDVKEVFNVAADISQKWKYSVPVVGLSQTYLSDGSVLYLLGALLLTVLVAVVFLFLADKFYLRGALNMQNAKVGKELSDAVFEKLCRQKKPIDALVSKEYRLVRRNPAYFTQNFLYGFLWPVVVLVMMKKLIPLFMTLFNSNASGNGSYMNWGDFDTFVFMTFILSVAITFIAWIPLFAETLAFSSLSREGNDFFIMKQIPVSYKDQLEAKRKMATRFSHITITGYVFILLVLMAILVKLPFYYIIIPVILTALFTEEYVAMDMLLGIRDANVSWSNEKTAATKSSTAVVLLAFVQLLVPGALAYAIGGPFFEMLPGVLKLLPLFIVAIVLILLRILLVKRIYISGEKKIRRLRF